MSVVCNDGQRNLTNDDYDYDDWMYALLEKLPTVAECVQAILHHASSYGTNRQKDHIHQFALRITEIMEKGIWARCNLG